MDLSAWLSTIESSTKRNVSHFKHVKVLAQTLQIDHFQQPVITVAGTNGKGSCIALMEGVLLNAGYRVGSYTSPHLQHFNERIRINGNSVDDQKLCDAFEKISSLMKTLTYFEFITLAALTIFQETPLELLLLEVGLGGRFDAVNIVDPDIAVITSIGLDHTDLLGNSRDAIAKEKAGIIRRNKPLVCGDRDPPHSLIHQAEQKGADCYFVGNDYTYSIGEGFWSCRILGKTYQAIPSPKLYVNNAATALMALALLPFNIKRSSINFGVSHTKLPGRLEIIRTNPLCILDVAHNPDACRLLFNRLQKLPCQGRTFAVFGLLRGKNLEEIVTVMRSAIDAWYIGELPTDRSLPANEIMVKLQDMGVQQCYNAATIELALNQALDHCQQNDRILVFGSFYAVASTRRQLSGEKNGS